MSAFFNPISLVHLNYLPFFLSETVEEPLFRDFLHQITKNHPLSRNVKRGDFEVKIGAPGGI